MAIDAAEAIRSFFSSRTEGLAAVYLFGSLARGSAGPRSDADVAVLYQVPPGRSFEALPLDLEGELERLLQRPVDLIVLNSAPPDLVHRVLRDGVLLLEPDRPARIRFEVQSRNQYFDILPLLERYRRLRGAMA
jgi:predicted nucleotidyltransferase